MISAGLTGEDWKEYAHAIDLFNKKYFWECHEVLEDVWMTQQPPMKTYLQGIIQAAAAFYHVLNENPRGCIKLAADSRSKLKKFSPEYMQLPLEELLTSLSFFEEESNAILESKKKEFTLERLPLLRLKHS